MILKISMILHKTHILKNRCKKQRNRSTSSTSGKLTELIKMNSGLPKPSVVAESTSNLETEKQK
jgi:hypothetical protein